MKTVNVLAIGNSFSADATYYLHKIALAAGVETRIVNLYIGGCSLERHWRNIEKEEREYQYQRNGVITERYVSIQEALAEEKWDYIVIQQASHDSGWADSYEPFLGLMIAYLKENAPKAEVLIHETWAYEIDSSHDCFLRYHRSQDEMYEKLRNCYHEAAERYDLRLIPCGDVIQLLRKMKPFIVQEGGQSLCRDGFHMQFIYGRYLLACVWVKVLFGVNIQKNGYIPITDCQPGERPDNELLAVIKECVDNFPYVDL